jgi:hypothetical protein
MRNRIKKFQQAAEAASVRASSSISPVKAKTATESCERIAKGLDELLVNLEKLEHVAEALEGGPEKPWGDVSFSE